jgi:O-antigen ligase
LFIGYGTETARGAGGTSHVLGRYIPDAGTHSTYLNYLYRAGLPAALALIAIYGIAILHARAASRTADPTERAFSTLVTAALVTVAAHGLVLSLFVEPIYTLGVSLLVGLAMAAGTTLGRSVQPWRHRSA